MSNPPCEHHGMKMINIIKFVQRQRGERIARWGRAELVRFMDGRYELRGGTRADRLAAKEWCSLFLHEAAVSA